METIVLTRKAKFIKKIVNALTLKFLDKFEVLAPHQKLAIEIVEILLKDKETEVLWSPGEARYIKSKNIFVKISDQRISITIDSHPNDIWIPTSRFFKLTNIIDKEIEVRRNLMEEEILKHFVEHLEVVKKGILENGVKKMED